MGLSGIHQSLEGRKFLEGRPLMQPLLLYSVLSVPMGIERIVKKLNAVRTEFEDWN
jgi:hypothetical protein